jgi:hypothetical protein
MECVVALIGVVVADLLFLPEKEATSKKPPALSVNVTKEVPGDSTWSPATAATVDDEVSMMEDDDDDSYISPRSSKVLLAGRVAKDHSNATNEEEYFMLEDLNTPSSIYAENIFFNDDNSIGLDSPTRGGIDEEFVPVARIRTSNRMQDILKNVVRYKAASSIQHSYQSYKKKQLSSMTIQRAYRQHKQRRTENAAASQIQKRDRSVLVRLTLLLQAREQNIKATVNQRLYRVQVQRKTKQTAAALTIQTRTRAIIATLQKKKLETSATLIQRSYRKRRQRESQNAAALTIQMYYRRLRIRMEKQKHDQAGKTIQQAYRLHKQRQQERTAASKIQRHFRALRTTREKQKLEESGTVIQRAFRNHKQRTAEKVAASTIQAHYRALQTRKHQKQLKKSGKIIYRAYQKHKQKKAKNAAALTIQSRLRAHLASLQRKKLEESGKKIQRAYRRHNKRQLEYAASKIQGWYHGLRTRMRKEKLEESGTVIQCAYRKHKERQRHHAAALVIQDRFRVLVDSQRKQQVGVETCSEAVSNTSSALGLDTYAELETPLASSQDRTPSSKVMNPECDTEDPFFAAVRTQSLMDAREDTVFRDNPSSPYVIHRVYRQFQRRRKEHAAATTIQKKVRAVSPTLKKRNSELYQAIHTSSGPRLSVPVDCEEESKLDTSFSAVIQRAHQRYTRRVEENEAAARIQKNFRSLQAYWESKSIEESTITREDINRSHASSKAIQRAFRRYRTRTKEHKAASIIQKNFQTLVARAQTRKGVEEASNVLAESMQSRLHTCPGQVYSIQPAHCENTRREREHAASIVIQSRFRVFLAALRLRKMESSDCDFEELFSDMQVEELNTSDEYEEFSLNTSSSSEVSLNALEVDSEVNSFDMDSSAGMDVVEETPNKLLCSSTALIVEDDCEENFCNRTEANVAKLVDTSIEHAIAKRQEPASPE